MVGRALIAASIPLALVSLGFAARALSRGGGVPASSLPVTSHVLVVMGLGLGVAMLCMIGGRALSREFRRDTLAWYLDHPAACRIERGTLDAVWFEQRLANDSRYVWLLHLDGHLPARGGTGVPVNETIRLPIHTDFAGVNLDTSGPRRLRRPLSRAWYLTDGRADSLPRLVGVSAATLEPAIASVEAAARRIQRGRMTFWRWAAAVLAMLTIAVLSLNLMR